MGLGNAVNRVEKNRLAAFSRQPFGSVYVSGSQISNTSIPTTPRLTTRPAGERNSGTTVWVATAPPFFHIELPHSLVNLTRW
jgi:hypothetical protein